MNIKIKTVNTKFISLVLAGVITLSTSGCSFPSELSGDVSHYDILETNSGLDNENNELKNGIKQVIPVEGENFNLVIEYSSNDNEWRITSNKSLCMTIYTEGLTNKSVYIDTIHMDTSIVATNAYFDGIKQDTLDDHIHNSQMIGFPISDTNKYYGVNEIEGQNSEFIEGYTYGYNGHINSTIEQKRRLESDFLEQGVWANRIDGVIGLLIEDQTTGEIRAVDVPSTILVSINNKITYETKEQYTTYEYDHYGNRKIISEVPKSSPAKIRKVRF